jgi:hypothetical protein
MRRLDLVADCGNCVAICCVATSFDASREFAIDKPAGLRCPHVSRSFRCTIHREREALGFSGCIAYDCYGAGQKVTRAFAARPGADGERGEAFLALREIHELLWLLTEAEKLCPEPSSTLRNAIAREIETLDRIAARPMEELGRTDVSFRRRAATSLLRRVGDSLGGRDKGRRTLPVID